MPPRRFVFDTNIYRYSATSPEFETRIRKEFHSIRMSAVVLSELWRSAQTRSAQAYVHTIEQNLGRFIFAPTPRDWRMVGQYLSTRLSRAGRKPTADALHAIRKEQNDALIALSSWNQGFAVVTSDQDFERIRTWVEAPPWKLLRIPAPAPSP
ncbi:PIN domain-containing protein [Cystobacter fuscus]|uniref:PIN domain-containing protein n=1 Tax=Cystobacter fuscus TaxID=43 RepID=UPI002B2E7D39|nr:PIN domain-containing protein [Cystobacter fuscus]